MKAYLLAAGYATRLWPLTRDRPKPLLEVAGRPIVEDLLLQLAEAGVGPFRLVSNGRFAGRFHAWARELTQRSRSLEIDVVDDGALDEASRLGAVRDLALALDDEVPRGPH